MPHSSSNTLLFDSQVLSVAVLGFADYSVQQHYDAKGILLRSSAFVFFGCYLETYLTLTKMLMMHLMTAIRFWGDLMLF